MSSANQAPGTQPPQLPQTVPTADPLAGHGFQFAIENNQALGRIEGTLTGFKDRLEGIEGTSSKIEDRLRSLETTAAWLKGCLAAAVFLIPLCAVVVWWSLGTQIEAALKIGGG